MSACKRVLVFLAGSALAAGLALGVEVVVPPDGFAPGWTKTDETRVFERGGLFNYIDGGAELFIEFGCGKLIVQTYDKAEMELTLEVYELDGPESALGIYLLKCGRETPVKGISARNTGDRYQLTILRSRYFIHVNNADGLPEAVPAMTVLAQKLLAGLPEVQRLNVFDRLPQKGIIPGTERLFRGPFGLQALYTLGPGDILLQNRKLFGLAADYHSAEGDIYTRLLIPYPDAAAAQAGLKHLLENLDSYLQVVASDAQGFVFRDFQKKYGRVELKDSLLEILVNLPAEPLQ